jgi:hypothetical protein
MRERLLGMLRFVAVREALTGADRVQIELWRRATCDRRSEVAGRLSADVMRLARRAIAEAFPDLDQWGQRIKFMEVHHGRELAARFERYLERRGLIRRDHG